MPEVIFLTAVAAFVVAKLVTLRALKEQGFGDLPHSVAQD